MTATTAPATTPAPAPAPAQAATPAPAASGSSWTLSGAMSSLFGHFAADPVGSTATAANAVAGAYDTASKGVPTGVAVPENPVSENLGFFSKWWPVLKGALEMGQKGPAQADAAVVGEGATSAAKNVAGMAADAAIGPGAGDMAEAALSGLESVVDPFVPHKEGVKGLVGEEVKTAGEAVMMLVETGGEALDEVAGAVNTGAGAAAGAIDAVHAGASSAIRILGAEPDTSGLPTELPPIVETVAAAPPAPVLPPTDAVTLPVGEADPLAVAPATGW